MGQAQKQLQGKNTEAVTFGERLRKIRENRGYSQVQLGQTIGVSQRMIAYYENHAEKAPAHHLLKMSEVLRVTVDELVGRRAYPNPDPRNSRLWGKLRLVENLPRDDRKQVTRLIETLVEKENLKKEK